MKITTFNPQIITNNIEEMAKLFEKLGFMRIHLKEDIGDLNVTGIRMMNDDRFFLDLSQSEELPLKHDIIAIRMNVDNFDEAYKLLIDNGFKSIYGNKIVENPTSKSTVMVSSNGLAINLIEHIKGK